MSSFEFTQPSPLRLSLVAGASVTSYFLWGNSGATSWGIVPFIQHSDSKSLSMKQKVSAWRFFYNRAKFHFAPCAIIGPAFLLYVAANTPVPAVRTLTLAASALSFSIFPFTIAVLLPTNNKLEKMLDQKELDDAPAGSVKEKEASDLINQWKRNHFVRVVLGVGAWLAATGALVLDN
ncbi:hypothetical protein PLICRDRAFT_195959 [Plicaturopsis crispa FD-325 SS-3]|nr:hypothetical protein PLICRDRAFT_195959 [Plicaturopsis crispa FD-325 SS-3]